MPIKLSTPPSLTKVLCARKPVRDVNAEYQEQLTPLQRLALFISDHVGTPGFFFLIVIWTVIWLSYNLLAPKFGVQPFDRPMGFVFWLFISNMLQIILMPLIMVAQNLQSEHAERRASNDYEVNLKSEENIEIILRHLEYQNAVLHAIAARVGLELEPEDSVEEKIEQLICKSEP